jgi:hypothetical protein
LWFGDGVDNFGFRFSSPRNWRNWVYEYKSCLTSQSFFSAFETAIAIRSRVARWFVFKPKIQICVNFRGSCNGRCWYILWTLGTVFYILWTFGIVRGNLVYIFLSWYFVPRKFWQPWLRCINLQISRTTTETSLRCSAEILFNKFCLLSRLPDYSWYNIPKREKLYQMTAKNAKWPQNIPKGSKTFRMTIKHTSILKPRPSKKYPKWNFWYQNVPSGNPAASESCLKRA